MSSKDAAAGYAAGAVTDAIMYIVDSYKTQSQTNQPIRLSRLTRGLGPLSMLGSGPTLACFFGIYQPTQEYLGGGPTAVAAAAFLATIPSSLVGVPADTLKKQLVAGHYPNVQAAAAGIVRAHGVQGLFVGWQTNLLRDIPGAVIKMTLYEGMTSLYTWATRSRTDDATDLSTQEHGVIGFASGSIAAVLTNPLDVVNTRIKAAAGAGGSTSLGIWGIGQQVLRAEGPAALFAGLPARLLIFGVGSSIFWSVHAKVRRMLSDERVLNPKERALPLLPPAQREAPSA